MTIKQEVQIWQDVDVDIDIDEIYQYLSRSEKEELFELLLENHNRYNNNYYIESIILGKSDSDILTNKKVWDKIFVGKNNNKVMSGKETIKLLKSL